MKTKTIQLYEYSELSPEAKEKALATHRSEGFDGYELQVYLDIRAGELLEKHGIVPEAGTFTKLLYSLGHSQGDGLMFEGSFTFKNNSLTIKQWGHYLHSYSKQITWHDFTGEEKEPEEEKIAAEFEKAYQAICKELEKEGYAHIEEVESEGYFIELCNANEYTFREDGVMENDND